MPIYFQISPEDQLPKKICVGCSSKLDTLYKFRDKCINSENQLLEWLSEESVCKNEDFTNFKPHISIKEEPDPVESPFDFIAVSKFYFVLHKMTYVKFLL